MLFGSWARGENGAGSDVEVLVIEPTVEDPMQESVRLRRSLRGPGVPIDVLVITKDEADRRSVVRGTVVERAVRDEHLLTPDEEESPRMLSADQPWFWTERAQAREREVDAHVGAGELARFDSDESFLSHLDSLAAE